MAGLTVRESYSKGANPPQADRGLWFRALMVPGILHNSLPFGGWMRNALKTFCIGTAVMGKLHRGMLAATFKLHAGLRTSFFFFFKLGKLLLEKGLEEIAFHANTSKLTR